MKKILFLYTELAEYVLASMQALQEHQVELHIVRWPVNSEAPFEFRKLDDVFIYDRSTFTDESLTAFARDLRPDLILTSGWIDKGYLKVNTFWYQKCPTVLLLDNHYTGDIKQKIAALISPFWLKTKFSHAWVPGDPQFAFARKLGFKKEDIRTGFYCADTELFTAFSDNHPERETSLPNRFIYIGRYIDFKGVEELWEAFTAFRKMHPEWELICIGTGELWERRTTNEGIKHLGFIQPADLPEQLLKAGVFVLPSRKEPWGVVIHEMAAAGFPLICSNTIGAATRFLEEGKNGFSFKAHTPSSIQEAMEKMALLTDEERSNMGAHSKQLAKELTPDKWATTLLSFLP
ncbi:MAG: glycosyltransferase involved in cell wall biosynthesis [Flavobacteriales bacterium]|jgi:glycosyltransferase involved in cell wall biosynthesis